MLVAKAFGLDIRTVPFTNYNLARHRLRSFLMNDLECQEISALTDRITNIYDDNIQLKLLKQHTVLAKNQENKENINNFQQSDSSSERNNLSTSKERRSLTPINKGSSINEDKMASCAVNDNTISRVFELITKLNEDRPTEEYERSGPEHCPTFTCTLNFKGREYCGQGASKANAKAAAFGALEFFLTENTIPNCRNEQFVTKADAALQQTSIRGFALYIESHIKAALKHADGKRHVTLISGTDNGACMERLDGFNCFYSNGTRYVLSPIIQTLNRKKATACYLRYPSITWDANARETSLDTCENVESLRMRTLDEKTYSDDENLITANSTLHSPSEVLTDNNPGASGIPLSIQKYLTSHKYNYLDENHRKLADHYNNNKRDAHVENTKNMAYNSNIDHWKKMDPAMQRLGDFYLKEPSKIQYVCDPKKCEKHKYCECPNRIVTNSVSEARESLEDIYARHLRKHKEIDENLTHNGHIHYEATKVPDHNAENNNPGQKRNDNEMSCDCKISVLLHYLGCQDKITPNSGTETDGITPSSNPVTTDTIEILTSDKQANSPVMMNLLGPSNSWAMSGGIMANIFDLAYQQMIYGTTIQFATDDGFGKILAQIPYSPYQNDYANAAMQNVLALHTRFVGDWMLEFDSPGTAGMFGEVIFAWRPRKLTNGTADIGELTKYSYFTNSITQPWRQTMIMRDARKSDFYRETPATSSHQDSDPDQPHIVVAIKTKGQAIYKSSMSVTINVSSRFCSVKDAMADPGIKPFQVFDPRYALKNDKTKGYQLNF